MTNHNHPERALLLGFSLLGLTLAAPFVLKDTAQAQPLAELAGQAAPSVDPAYFSGYRWNRTELTYSFGSCPRSLDCEVAHQTVREALATWDAVSGLSLSEVSGTGDIHIRWVAGDDLPEYPLDGPGGRVGQAGYPYYDGALWIDGDIFLDDDETWVAGPADLPFPQQVSLASAALHEAGHALGLGHTSDPTSIMHGAYTGQAELSAQDVAAILALYGPQ